MIKSIQYLRGIAAVLVFCHHWVQLTRHGEALSTISSSAYNYGPFGVNLFFVISGFIITRTNLLRPAPPFLFAARRIVRIYPAYWVFTFLLVIAAAWFPGAFRFTSYDTTSLTLSMLLIPNHNPSGIGLYPFLTVGWTLTFELLFYAIVCAFIYVSRTKWITYSIVLLIGLAGFYPKHFVGSNILGSKHLLEFAAGMLIARFYGLADFIPNNTRSILSILLLIGGIVMLKFGANYWIFSAVLVVISFILPSGIIFPKFIDFALSKIGNISYSLYLTHIVVIGIIAMLWRSNFSEFGEVIPFSLAVFLTFILAWVGFTFIELPTSLWLKAQSGIRLRQFDRQETVNACDEILKK